MNKGGANAAHDTKGRYKMKHRLISTKTIENMKRSNKIYKTIKEAQKAIDNLIPDDFNMFGRYEVVKVIDMNSNEFKGYTIGI